MGDNATYVFAEDYEEMPAGLGILLYNYWDLRLRLLNLYVKSEGNDVAYFRLKAKIMKELTGLLEGDDSLWKEFTEGIGCWKEFKDGTTEASE